MNSTTSVIDAISKLEAEVSSKQQTLLDLKALIGIIPDVRIYRSDANMPGIFFSRSSNNKTVEMDFTEDANGNIFIWPRCSVSVNDKTTSIYSDPPYYLIGSKNAKGFGIQPIDGIIDTIANDEISEKLVKEIKAYLKNKPPISYLS